MEDTMIDPSSYWDLSGLAYRASCSLASIREGGLNALNLSLLAAADDLCSVLERGKLALTSDEQHSLTDIHVAESFQRLLDTAHPPRIRQIFHDLMAQAADVQQTVQEMGAGSLPGEQRLSELEEYFSRLALVLSTQMLSEYQTEGNYEITIGTEDKSA